ncbi:MAG: hypothetical protein ABDI20_09405 [Candidatus Bipolaricaulaceae bacterium]
MKFFIATLGLLGLASLLHGCTSPLDLVATEGLIKITSVNAPTQAPANSQIMVEVIVSYSLSVSNKEILVQVYEHGGPLIAETTRIIGGRGVISLEFVIITPPTPKLWRLDVHIFRRDTVWQRVDLKSLTINVIESLPLAIEAINFPSRVNTNQHFILEVLVRYSLPTLTGVMVQVYEHAGPLIVSQRKSLSGRGIELFQFALTAPMTPRQWQLNVHLFRWDQEKSDWLQVDLKGIVLTVQQSVRVSRYYYLFPPNIHLLPGERSRQAIKILNDEGLEMHGLSIVFHVYSDLISISSDGYVTALRSERLGERGAMISATVDGIRASNDVVVRVLSTRHDFAFNWITTEHTALYYPSRINGEDLEVYVKQYEIPKVNEYAYQIQASLLGTVPWDGAKQIFAVEFFEDESNSVCGLGYINPIRIGWKITGTEWSNCFLVPHIPPRSPQWLVLYHELAHSFTLENDAFKSLFQGIEEYSEGLATALALFTAEIIIRSNYAINSATRASLELLYYHEVKRFLQIYEEWVKSGIPFPSLSQLQRNDMVDGIWLYWKTKRGNFASRFFSLFHPRYAHKLAYVTGKAQTIQDKHTLFAALVSAAVGQDLSSVFLQSYGFPLNTTLFYDAYQAFLDAIGP